MNEALLAARLMRTEAALSAAQETAEAAKEAKRCILAHLSERIRTPLNGLMGTLEHVLHSSLSAEQRSQLLSIQNSAEDFRGLLEDLLDNSRLKAGELALRLEDFRLRTALDEVLQPLLVRARKRGLNLTRYVAPDVPDALYGDSGRLRQVLTNLVGNAVKFTFQGSIHVTVDAQHHCAHSEQATTNTLPEYELRVVVSDSGIGMEPEQLARLSLSDAVEAGGVQQQARETGLGLSVSRQLVSLMRGTIQARSQPGKGSEFSFTVRLQEAREPVPVNAQSTADFAIGETSDSEVPSSASSEARPPRRLRVLVADDHAICREVAAAILQNLGHPAPVFAENGRAALDQILQTEFDVVLMDLQMPVLDGLEATRELRRREDAAGAPRLPVIALTSHTAESDRQACLTAGMDDFLTKPVRRAALAQALDSVREKSAGSTVVSASEPFRLTPELTELLRRTTDDGLAQLRAALTQHDLVGAGRAAHFIKGGLGILDDPLLLNMTAEIEDALVAGDVATASRLTEQLAASVYRSLPA